MGVFDRNRGKQFAKFPQFTSIDFYFNPLWLSTLPGPVLARGKAIQLITYLDAFRYFVPPISGTDTENCQCTSQGTLSVLTAALPNATLNGAGTVATFAAAANTVQVVTTVAMPAGTLTLGTFTITGTSQPSATASTCVVAAGVQVTFPGGPAGTYTLNTPIFTGTVSPGHAGDATFNPNGAVIAGVAYTFLGVLQQNCTSTWTQPYNTPILNTGVIGYVHLNKLNPHGVVNATGMANINVTQQTIPIPCSPAVIRVEQEFDQVIIEPQFNLAQGFPLVGILIIEHEQDQVTEWTP